MKNKTQNIILLFLATALALSCTKRVDIPLQQGNLKLVVEGYLFGNDSVSWVRLTQTSDYFSNRPSPSVSGASVILSDKVNRWILKESPSKPGYYFLDDSTFSPAPSDTFKLKIELKQPVGGHSTYESQTAIPPLRLHIDSLGIEFAPDFKKWMVRYYGQDLPGSDYYLFNSSVNGKIVTDSILQKVVREDAFFDGRYVSGAVVQILNENVMKPGDYYTLLASNITKEYYEYLTALQEEVEDKNPLFSGPPANVQGNISNGALGFFTAFLTTSYVVKLKSLKKPLPEPATASKRNIHRQVVN